MYRFTIRDLNRRLAAENCLWGAPRIHGELGSGILTDGADAAVTLIDNIIVCRAGQTAVLRRRVRFEPATVSIQ